ncbi:VC0807 family protein [Amycolatopsis sp. NPDC058986]|uniref:VC0807 family protein n=1 Tax=unclassified Amycolatopsis TaxID=2618356 RepID=UPI0036710A7C
MTFRSLLRVLGEAVVLPLATFAILSAVGVPEVWALVGSATTSILIVAGRYRRTGTGSTLGLIMLARFAAGVVVALGTGDATLTLAKDPAFTALVACGALGTLFAGLPLTARIRRELAADPAAFDRLWRARPGYRRVHRRLTVLWVAGLLLESAAGFVIVYTVDFTGAVVLTRLLGPLVLIVLSAWTAYRDARGLLAGGSAGPAPRPSTSDPLPGHG